MATGDRLIVRRRVVTAILAATARRVPGVAGLRHGGPPLVRALRGRAVRTRVGEGRVDVRIWLVARADARLIALAAQVRSDLARTVRDQLGMEPGEVTVVVDGVAR